MCGFAGQILASGQLAEKVSKSYFQECAARLSHRGDTETNALEGPQGRDQGPLYWLVHHRLAFQDLAQGRQPMRDLAGDWLIVFNGEVYNHLELRETLEQLRGIPWRSRSDTETLLEGFRRLGESFFDELEGEYSFVLLREDGSELLAHRDRSGVKPLFFHLEGVKTETFACYQEHYEVQSDLLSFASEIKGIARTKAFDHDGFLRQFVGLYEPLRTPFASTIALCGGGLLHATRQGQGFSVRIKTRAKPVRTHSRLEGDTAQWIAGFSEEFQKSVEERLLSDVELGVYLSGGVDSRAVATQLSRSADPRFGRHAFTVGFHQAGYDESLAAREYAQSCGFTSHLLMLGDEALSYSYPLAVEASENIQPYTNGAAKWWLSRMTRQHVKGVLTGDGSDELLCGYPSFRYVKWWMHAMRGGERATNGLRGTPLGTLPRDSLYFKAFLSQSKDPWLAGSSAAGTGLDFVESLATWGVPHPLYGQITSITKALLGPKAQEWLEQQGPSIRSWYLAGLGETDNPLDPSSALRLWQNYFFRTHLPVQVLNWVGDRMEMANVLEGRTPFLSRRMRRFVRSLPDRMLVHGFEDKFILRRALSHWVGGSFAQAPKKQFGAPFIGLPDHFSEDTLAAALQATGLDHQTILRRIDETSKRLSAQIRTLESQASASDADRLRLADARYESSHLAQVHQTLVSLAIVKHTLVDEKSLSRDGGFETSILAGETVST